MVHLGLSREHASTVPLVLNLETGVISPQFHSVLDDWFQTKDTFEEVLISTATSRILPGTWAFKRKRRPDSTVKKFKGRFCIRGLQAQATSGWYCEEVQGEVLRTRRPPGGRCRDVCAGCALRDPPILSCAGVGPRMGHLHTGFRQRLTLHQHYMWPNMSRDILRYVKNCPTCQ